MIMTNELKPCPFCGGKGEAVHYESDNFYGSYEIQCSKCTARITPYDAEGYDAHEIASKAWNTRQPVDNWKPIEECKLEKCKTYLFCLRDGRITFANSDYFLIKGELIMCVCIFDKVIIETELNKTFSHYIPITPAINQAC